MKREIIAVLGGGSWGTTLASYLAKRGHHMFLWEFDPKIAKKLKINRTIDTLPGLKLPDSVEVSNNIEDILKDKDIILSVTPSHAVRSTFSQKGAKNHLKRGALIISATKGLEVGTHLTMSQVIKEIFTDAGDIVILSGPSHAEEVAMGHPVAVVAASNSPAASKKVQEMVGSDTFRIYTSDDPLGVELAGSLKNIYAIACGIVDGLSLGDSTKSALMTRALAEITRLGIKLKASPLTFFGLAGLGDMIVTCTSQFSRNRHLGELIGQGDTLDKALKKMTMVAEGVNTTRSAYELAKMTGVVTPIINEMHLVLFKNKSPKDSLRDLMGRQMGSEMEGIVL
ncbi:MAG: NAD(P)-dependent glycerol-3-phosphate dehydrogenase [Elusimicrobia bacterium]|nr:NAD(P)-dependent glycerol-3-phosphate dehydrogenase [Candidatus Obscuribacterium magneticum]